MAHITNPHNARGFTLLWCSTLAFLPAIALASSLSADPTPLLLFPGGAPNETDGFPGPEARAPNDGGGCGALHSSACDHIYNVSAPSLTPFVVTNGTGASVVIAPGGGYVDLSWTKEGLDMARMFNRNGVSAFVLKYRVPARPALEGLPKWWAPLQDAQRAIGVVRAGAKRWGLDPGKVGFIGFSAGGHLSVSFELGLWGVECMRGEDLERQTSPLCPSSRATHSRRHPLARTHPTHARTHTHTNTHTHTHTHLTGAHFDRLAQAHLPPRRRQ
jgi:hypothetical protein